MRTGSGCFGDIDAFSHQETPLFTTMVPASLLPNDWMKLLRKADEMLGKISQLRRDGDELELYQASFMVQDFESQRKKSTKSTASRRITGLFDRHSSGGSGIPDYDGPSIVSLDSLILDKEVSSFIDSKKKVKVDTKAEEDEEDHVDPPDASSILESRASSTSSSNSIAPDEDATSRKCMQFMKMLVNYAAVNQALINQSVNLLSQNIKNSLLDTIKDVPEARPILMDWEKKTISRLWYEICKEFVIDHPELLGDNTVKHWPINLLLDEVYRSFETFMIESIFKETDTMGSYKDRIDNLFKGFKQIGINAPPHLKLAGFNKGIKSFENSNKDHLRAIFKEYNDLTTAIKLSGEEVDFDRLLKDLCHALEGNERYRNGIIKHGNLPSRSPPPAL
jgi:hypothetical protein